MLIFLIGCLYKNLLKYNQNKITTQNYIKKIDRNKTIQLPSLTTKKAKMIRT